MTKLLEFPKALTGLTYREAVQEILDATEDDIGDKKVTNLIMIGFKGDDYQFGILNMLELRGLLGTIECVKHCLLCAMDEAIDFDDE